MSIGHSTRMTRLPSSPSPSPPLLSSFRPSLLLPVLLLSLSLPPAAHCFFTDQPEQYVSTTNSTLGNITSYNAAFELSFDYRSTTVLIYTNASNITATIGSVIVPDLPLLDKATAAPELPYTPAILMLPFSQWTIGQADQVTAACKAADLYGSGDCVVSIALCSQYGSSEPGNATGASVFSYAVYPMANIELGRTYSGELSVQQWQYYAVYITYDDLDVNFNLTPLSSADSSATPDVDLYLSSDAQPLTLLFPAPYDGNEIYSHEPGTVEDVILASGGGAASFYDGIYIIGVYCPAGSANGTQYTLTLTGGIDDESSTVFGVSMFAIVAALTVLVLCLFSAAAVIARRRRVAIREYNAAMATAIDGDHAEALRRLHLRGLTPSGVMAVPPPFQGATEEEIAALPCSLYRPEASDGDREGAADDARCTICLDEWRPGVSSVTELPCGHSFCSACIQAWLRQRRHCPLCLQNVSNAHNVAKRADAEPAEIEMVVSIVPSQQAGARTSSQSVVGLQPQVEERKEQL